MTCQIITFLRLFTQRQCDWLIVFTDKLIDYCPFIITLLFKQTEKGLVASNYNLDEFYIVPFRTKHKVRSVIIQSSP
jgi:hypothetical protein